MFCWKNISCLRRLLWLQLKGICWWYSGNAEYVPSTTRVFLAAMENISACYHLMKRLDRCMYFKYLDGFHETRLFYSNFSSHPKVFRNIQGFCVQGHGIKCKLKLLTIIPSWWTKLFLGTFIWKFPCSLFVPKHLLRFKASMCTASEHQFSSWKTTTQFYRCHFK